jgi:hypothetical protein
LGSAVRHCASFYNAGLLVFVSFCIPSADVPKEDDVLIEKDEILDEKSLFCASVRGRFLIAARPLVFSNTPPGTGAAGNVRIQTAYALQTKYLTARIEGQASNRLPRRCGFPFRIPDSQKWWIENTDIIIASEISVISEISDGDLRNYGNFRYRFIIEISIAGFNGCMFRGLMGIK